MNDVIQDNYLSRINSHSVASTDDAAYFIGGDMGTDNGQSDIIAQFRNEAWSIYGKLKKTRKNHESISFGDKIMIFGGATNETS